MSRRLPLILASLAIVALLAGGWWWWRHRTGPVAPTTAASLTAVAPQVRLQLDLIAAVPGEDAALVVRAFDAGTLQREALEAAEKAAGRRIAGSGRDRTMKTPAIAIPDDWAAGLTVRLGAPNQAETDLTRTAAPSGDPQTAVFAITAPPANSRVTAAIRLGGRTFTARTTAPRAPADPARLAQMRGRVAEALGRPDGLRAASAALLFLKANDPWGLYFLGTAAELAGDRAAAKEAYSRAVAASTSGQEPPVLLLERLRALK